MIDKSTPEDAVNILGAPDKDLTDSLKILRIKSWLVKEIKDKKYHFLEFRKVDDYSKVKLAFLDNKLILIEAEGSERQPVNLELRFVKDMEMRLVYDADDISGQPGTMLKVRRRRSYFTNPGNEYIIGASEKTFVVCLTKTGTPSHNGQYPTYPIYLDILQIVSRSLERR